MISIKNEEHCYQEQSSQRKKLISRKKGNHFGTRTTQSQSNQEAPEATLSSGLAIPLLFHSSVPPSSFFVFLYCVLLDHRSLPCISVKLVPRDVLTLEGFFSLSPPTPTRSLSEIRQLMFGLNGWKCAQWGVMEMQREAMARPLSILWTVSGWSRADWRSCPVDFYHEFWHRTQGLSHGLINAIQIFFVLLSCRNKYDLNLEWTHSKCLEHQTACSRLLGLSCAFCSFRLNRLISSDILVISRL